MAPRHFKSEYLLPRKRARAWATLSSNRACRCVSSLDFGGGRWPRAHPRGGEAVILSKGVQSAQLAELSPLSTRTRLRACGNLVERESLARPRALLATETHALAQLSELIELAGAPGLPRARSAPPESGELDEASGPPALPDKGLRRARPSRGRRRGAGTRQHGQVRARGWAHGAPQAASRRHGERAEEGIEEQVLRRRQVRLGGAVAGAPRGRRG
jgi:hypothetical protein